MSSVCGFTVRKMFSKLSEKSKLAKLELRFSILEPLHRGESVVL